MTRTNEITNCQLCGRLFRATSHNQRYCSPTCRLEAAKIQHRKYSNRYHAKHKEQEKRSRQKRRGGDIKPLEPDEAAEQAVGALSARQIACLRFLFMPARRITIDGEEW